VKCGASSKSKNSPDVLVVNAATRTMNPTIDEKVINAAYEDDPIVAAAEYGAEFRRDVEVFLPFDALEGVRMAGRFEMPYQPGKKCLGFLDAAGGTGADSMTMGIAHFENSRSVLDAIREVRLTTAFRS